MHQNPVKRGLVDTPEAWPWSSYRTYTFSKRNAMNMHWHFPPFTMRRVPPRYFWQLWVFPLIENRDECGTRQ